MRSQPVPEVTRADVERVLRRDFPEDSFAAALSLLDEYHAGSGPPSARVQLAVLKLAEGDLAALKRFIEDAKADHRDVIGWAEYPEYRRRVSGLDQSSEADQIIETDWKQYQAWLAR